VSRKTERKKKKKRGTGSGGTETSDVLLIGVIVKKVNEGKVQYKSKRLGGWVIERGKEERGRKEGAEGVGKKK